MRKRVPGESLGDLRSLVLRPPSRREPEDTGFKRPPTFRTDVFEKRLLSLRALSRDEVAVMLSL